MTNVLTESGMVNGMNFVATSLGTATGDLRGGLGVYFFSITGVGTPKVVAMVHHHWVTEAGDTIFLGMPRRMRFKLALSLAYTELEMIATLSRSLVELVALLAQMES